MQRTIHLLSLSTLTMFCLILFAPALCYAKSHELVEQYAQQAEILSKQGDYFGAARMFEKSAAAEQASPEPRSAYLSVVFNEAGFNYNQVGQYDKAIEYYQRALEIDRKLGKETNIAVYNNNIGTVYYSWGRYDKAIEHYQHALEFFMRHGEEASVATLLNNIGSVYDSLGQYDKAIEHYQQALDVGRRLGKKTSVALRLNNIGMVYLSWGQYDMAIKYFQQALEINRELGKETGIAQNLNNIGGVYNSRGQYEKAIKHFQQALEIYRKLGMEAEIANLLNNTGLVNKSWRQYDKAIDKFQQAMKINRRLGRKADIARNLNNIGFVYSALDQYLNAIEHYQQALVIDRMLGTEAEIAASLNNIGAVYGSWGQYEKAVDYYKKSIQLIEKIRLTAQGNIRRDYLASQIYTYQLLAFASLKNGDPDEVLAAVEQSRARLLAERIAGIDVEMEMSTLSQVQKGLTEDEAVLLFSNIDHDDFIIMAITSREIDMEEVSKESFLANSREQYKIPISMSLKNQRGLTIAIEEKGEKFSHEEQKRQADFETAIHYYRTLLTNPEKQEEARNFGRLLHALLIEPVGETLAGKTKITIMPDGILGFLPFETLVDESNNYLVQECYLRYTQSLTIDKLLQSRDYTNRENRKPLLAMGGAVYDEQHYETGMVDNSKQLAWLQKETNLAIEEKRSARSSYASLGMANWSNLPGTLEEVNELSAIIKEGEILTGEKVTENRIKAYSKSGKLAEYKVLHFATHGLVVPELPELSAIVLSQFREEQEGEDGYLRMGEIAELDLAADFINLSACETGLGKIYSGEGIVGLTQSFLIAGANGLSVSLWQVADESTAKFMTELYKKVQTIGMGYRQALTEVKREFINGDYGEQWKSPFYWSPFVYYGD